MKSFTNIALKRTIKFTITLVLIVLLFLSIRYVAVPISRPFGSVHNYVLKKIPVGTSWEDCQQIANDKDWEIRQTSDLGLDVCYEDGTGYFATEDDIRNGVKFPYREILGDKSMLIYLGEYHNPLDTAVYTYIAFDEKGELIDVFIRKDIDAP